MELYGGFDGSESSRSERNWSQHRSILDGDAGGTVVTIQSGSDETTQLNGFTIRNGLGSLGGGIQSINASPTIANNRIVRNRAQAGGGIYTENSSALILTNQISHNAVENPPNTIWEAGGGICNSNSAVTIEGNTIVLNQARFGGGIRCWDGTSVIRANRIAANQAVTLGGGIEIALASVSIERNHIGGNSVIEGDSSAVSVVGSGLTTMTGNLVLANNDPERTVYVSSNTGFRLFNNTFLGNQSDHATLQIDTQDFEAANNIIAFNAAGLQVDAGPGWRNNCVFANANGDYTGGIGDPTGTNGNIAENPMLTWSREIAEFHLQTGSPCVDTGDSTGIILPTEDIDGEPRVFGSSVDMGADELGIQPLFFCATDCSSLHLRR